MALSVRVGRAHVTVDGVYRPSSMKKVGKQIEAQLSAIAARNRSFYQSLGTDMVTAWRAALGAMVTSAPLIGSLVSGLTGGVTMLAGALWSTLTAASAALPVLTSIGIAAGTAKIAFTGFGSAVSAADPESLTAALAKLSPEAGASAIAVRSLRDEVTNLRLVVQENFFAGLSDDIEKLATTLMPVATAGFGQMATVLNGLAQSMLDYVNSSAGLSVINDVFKNSASVVGALSGAVVPFLDGFLRLVNALSPAAERLAGRITDIAVRFQGWTQAEGFATRIDEGMQKAEKTAGLLFDVLGNLGSIIGNIFDAANPSTNTFLEILGRVTGRFKEFTESVGGQQAIAKWAEESVTVLSQFGETIRTVFEVLQDLADPRIITSFLATVEEAFTILGNLPLEAAVSAFADLAEALQPISGPMLAIIVAGVSLQMMFGSLLGQMGGAAGIFKTLKGGLDRLKTGFAGVGSSAGKHASSMGKFSAAIGKVGGILAKGLKFAGLIGLGVTIVSVIAKSENLQNKLKAVWGSVKGVFESLGTAFSGVSSAAGPLLSALDPIFKIFEKIVGIGVGLVLDTLKFAFDSLGKAIQGAGTIVSGFLTVLTGIFTLDFGMILDGLKTALGGIPALLQGLFGLFITFFAPARLLGLASKFFGALLPGIRAAIPGITTAIGGLISRILTFFVSLGPRLLSVGGSVIRSLGSGISTGFTAIRTVITNFITNFVAVLQAGFAFVRTAVSTAMTGIKTVFTVIWDGILIVIRGVWAGITAAFNAGLTMIRTIWDAGIAALRVVIDTVFVPIGQAIRGLLSSIVDVFRATGELIRYTWQVAWNSLMLVVQPILAALRGGISTALNAIRTVVSTVMNGIRSVFSSVWNAIRSVTTTTGNAIRSVVSTALNAVRSVVNSVMNTVRSIFSSVWNSIRSTVSSVVNSIRSTVSSVLNNIRSVVSSVMNAVRSVFSSVWNSIRSTVSSVLNAIRSAISSGMNAARSTVTSALNAVRSAFTSGFNAARSIVTSAMSAIRSAVTNGVSKVLSVIRSLPGKILSALGNLGSLLKGAGGKLISGLVSGITGSIGKVTGAMSNVASKIRSFLPFSPVKEGPLKAWNNGKPGKTLMGMLASGLERGAGDVTSVMDGVAKSLAGSTPSALSLPALTGSPSRAVASSVTSRGSTSSASTPGATNVYVTIDPKDLAGLRTVEDFVNMLGVRTSMRRR